MMRRRRFDIARSQWATKAMSAVLGYKFVVRVRRSPGARSRRGSAATAPSLRLIPGGRR